MIITEANITLIILKFVLCCVEYDCAIFIWSTFKAIEIFILNCTFELNDSLDEKSENKL